MRLTGNQCKGCTKRHVGCHGECESYKEAKAEHDMAVERKREYLTYIQYVADKNRKGTF